MSTAKRIKSYPILLAGGSGTRLWPVSRELFPKQLVKFIGDDSLIQSTIKRLMPVLDKDNIRVVCGQEHFHFRTCDRLSGEEVCHLPGFGASRESSTVGAFNVEQRGGYSAH